MAVKHGLVGLRKLLFGVEILDIVSHMDSRIGLKDAHLGHVLEHCMIILLLNTLISNIIKLLELVKG